MRFLLALGPVLFLAAAAFACDADEQRMGVAPIPTGKPATAVSPPFVVPTATATLLPVVTVLPPLVVPGWAVFHRSADLWIGKLDGSAARPLVEGTLGSQFAGVATDTDGQRTLYFTTLVQRLGTETDLEGSAIEVRRQRLDGVSPAETVATIRISDDQAQEIQNPFRDPDVSVAPDGRHLAYTDDEGLWILDIAAQERRLRLPNQICEFGDDISTCKYYREPSWSFDGSWLAVNEGHYEGSVALVLDPKASVTATGGTSDGPGGSWREWDPRSQRMCASQGGYQSLSAGILSIDLIFRDLGPELRSGSDIPAQALLIGPCAWSADGRIAMQYWRDERAYDQRLAVLSGEGEFLSETKMTLPGGALIAWLPDGSGFIVTYRDSQRQPQSRILLLDGSLHELAVETDDVVAVLPE